MKKQRKENIFKTQFEGMSQSEIDFFKQTGRKKSKKEKKDKSETPAEAVAPAAPATPAPAPWTCRHTTAP